MVAPPKSFLKENDMIIVEAHNEIKRQLLKGP